MAEFLGSIYVYVNICNKVLFLIFFKGTQLFCTQTE